MTGETGKFYFGTSALDTDTFFTCGFASPSNGQIMKYISGIESVKLDVSGYIFNGIKMRGVDGYAIAYDSAAIEGSIIRRIYRSTNSGESWIMVLEQTDQLNYYHRIIIIDDDMAYILGNDCLLKTIDSGATWNAIDIAPTMPLSDAVFVSNNTVNPPEENSNVDFRC